MRISPVVAGGAMGLVAAGAQAVFNYGPPTAYGVCVSCQGRDLANSIANWLFGLDLQVAQVSTIFPALTTVGILLAALIAAVLHREFRWRKGPPALRSFALGFVVMICGLLAGACTLRLFLRVAYGDLIALAAVPALLVGVWLGNLWLSGGARE
jgi:hypothetical protein